MAEVLVDVWAVVASAGRRVTDEEANRIREHVDRELVAAAVRLSALLGPIVRVRVEQ